MRLVLALPLLASLASAQYASSGWQPGQTVRAQRVQQPAYDPANPRAVPQPPQPPSANEQQPTPAAAPIRGGDFFSRLLASGPLGGMFQKAGVNISRAIENQHIDESWDTRIPLIYDDTFNDTVVNEKLTLEEEAKRVWFLIVCVDCARV